MAPKIHDEEEQVLRELNRVIKELKRTVASPADKCTSQLVSFTELLSFYHCLRTVSKDLNHLHAEYEKCLIQASTEQEVFNCVDKIKLEMEKTTVKMVEALNQCQTHLQCKDTDESPSGPTLVSCLAKAHSSKAVDACIRKHQGVS